MVCDFVCGDVYAISFFIPTQTNLSLKAGLPLNLVVLAHISIGFPCITSTTLSPVFYEAPPIPPECLVRRH